MRVHAIARIWPTPPPPYAACVLYQWPLSVVISKIWLWTCNPSLILLGLPVSRLRNLTDTSLPAHGYLTRPILVHTNSPSQGFVMWRIQRKGSRSLHNRRIDFPAPSLHMCGQSIEMMVQFKDHTESWCCAIFVLYYHLYRFTEH